MNFILTRAAAIVCRFITEKALTSADITRIMHYTRELEHQAIDKVIKHARTADLIRDIAGDLSDDVINIVVKVLRWVGQA